MWISLKTSVSRVLETLEKWLVELYILFYVDPTYIILLWIAYQVKLFQVVALCFYVYMCYIVPQK